MATDLPGIALVIPAFRAAATLPRCLDSILAQEYPALELAVQDGGSEDGTRAILERYSDRLAWWASAPDRGQADAINRGFAKTRAPIFNWLGADDRLEPGALRAVGQFFAENPNCGVYSGAVRNVYERGGAIIREQVQPPHAEALDLLPYSNPVAQPSTFFRRELIRRAFLVREDFHYAMDFELWNYLRRGGAEWRCTDQALAEFRHSEHNKTSTGGDAIIAEMEAVFQAYQPQRWPLTWWQKTFRHPLMACRKRRKGSFKGKLAKLALGALDLGLAPWYGYRQVKAMDWRFLVHAEE